MNKGCQYCRFTRIDSYVNKKRTIPTNYCPVCGARRSLKIDIPGINYPITYINQREVEEKLFNEIHYNLPDALPKLLNNLNIPEEYHKTIEELIKDELFEAIDMLDCKDEFTMLVPRDRWTSYTNLLKFLQKEDKE